VNREEEDQEEIQAFLRYFLLVLFKLNELKRKEKENFVRREERDNV
jgi:hypothetical protein